MSIGQTIRKIRMAKDITLREIEEATGIRNGYLSRLEHGQNSPSIDTLQRICDAIGAEIIIQDKEGR